MTCSVCRQPCIATEIDEGVGSTEFWGSVKNDVRIVVVSDCCDGGLYDESETP